MKATQLLHNLGQSIWLDNITRNLLDSGTLKRYIDELSVTGLPPIRRSSTTPSRTAPPTTPRFAKKLSKDKSGEALFFELALEDITRAAALFRPVHDQTDRRGRLGVAGSFAVAGLRHRQHPGRGQGSIRARGATERVHQDPRHQGRPAGDRRGDLRRHPDQRHALVLPRAVSGGGRGVPARRRAAHRRRAQSRVGSVASLFVSRWDAAVAGKVPESAARTSSASPSPNAPTKRTARCSIRRAGSALSTAGARPQRLLWASTGTKDPKASDVLYIKALAAPFTVNTMPEGTLKALADHGEIGAILPADGGDCEEVLAQFAKAGVDIDALAAQLQDEGAKSFVQSWNDLMAVIAAKERRAQEGRRLK